MTKRLLGILVLCLTSTACLDLDPCGNTIKQELTSPDGKYIATAFIRDCGATTDFSPQVDLRLAGKKMARTGNVFIGYHSDEIAIRWLSTNELEVSSPGEVSSSQKEFEGIKITIK